MTVGLIPACWLFENVALAITSVHLDGRILEANAAFGRLIGYSNEELRALTLVELAAGEERHAIEEFLAQLRNAQCQGFQVETRYRRKDGQVVWVHCTVRSVANAGVVPGLVLCIAENITEGKLAEEKLKKEQEALRKVFDHVPVIICLTDTAGSIRLLNKECEQTMGWAVGEALNDRLENVIGRDAETKGHRGETLFGEPYVRTEFQVQTKSGKIIDVSWLEVKLPDGSTIGIGTDVTEQKRAENELRRSEAYLAAGQRLSRTGSWAWVVGTDKVFWSQETFRIFEFDPENTTASLANTFLSRIHPDDRPRIEQGLAQTEHFSVDYRIVLPDGSIRHIHDVVYTTANEAGQIVERYGVVMDITDRKLAEEERQRSFDQLRALAGRLQTAREEERTRVAREIHDQLGQALTSIKIDLSSWVDDSPLRNPGSERIDSILKLVDETIKSVRRIATELRPGVLDDLGLVAAIEWAAEEFEARTGTKCRLMLSELDQRPNRERDTALFRILQETLTNVARHADATSVDIHLFRELGSVILKIQDNGCGTTPERLFAPTSLGIRGMKERALLLGGDLVIRSSREEGTTVLVRVPQE